MRDSIIPFYKTLNKTIVKAKDFLMFDAEGNRYVDFESGDWAAILGHSNERVNRAMREQMDCSIHDGLQFRNRPSEDLSAALLEILGMPGGQSTFLNSGSEAVNLGITLAKNLTGREKILKIEQTFLSAYGHGQISAKNVNLLNIPMDDAAAISGLDFSEIAVFVFEPGNSCGMVKFPGAAFVESVVSAASADGCLIMANEVTTGFGRTGKWFGSQYYDVQPDIITTGKGLGNGYPISAVSISAGTAARFEKNGFRYAQSHQNDPLGCAVGLEVIRAIRDESLIEASYEKGAYFKDRLLRLQATFPEKITDARGRGLMLAVEFYSPVDVEEIHARLLEAGLITGLREKTLRFMPPLTLPRESIDRLVEALEGILR